MSVDNKKETWKMVIKNGYQHDNLHPHRHRHDLRSDQLHGLLNEVKRTNPLSPLPSFNQGVRAGILISNHFEIASGQGGITNDTNTLRKMSNIVFGRA